MRKEERRSFTTRQEEQKKKKKTSQVAFFTSDKTLSGPETLECVQKAAVSQDWFFTEWKEYYFQMASWGVDQSVLKGVPASAVSGRK